MLRQFLSSGNQKTIAGVSLTPGIGLELVVYDKKQQCITKYGRKKVEYNFSTREIQDYTHFKTSLTELSNELGLEPKTMAFMVLPNVYFDFAELPPGLGDAEIGTALLAKAEDFYIFKKEEPIAGFCQVLNPDGEAQSRYAFSAFQRSVTDQLKNIFADAGLHLVGVESSYGATLRGLFAAGLVDDMIESQGSWTTMIINTNSYTLLQMDGQDLINSTEVPLAIKSFSAEEAYQAIVSSSSQILGNGNFDAQRLYIVSQTNDISAKILKKSMDYEREMVAIDTNKYARNSDPLVATSSAVDYDKARTMTLCALGAACFRNDFKLVMNALAGDPDASMGIYFTTKFLGDEVDVTNDFIMRLCVTIAVFAAVIFGSIYGICGYYISTSRSQITSLESEIRQLDKKIEAESSGTKKQEVDMNVIIDEIAQMNVTANSFYDSIATDIPQNVWLTKYFNKQGDKIAVRGVAQNIVDIYEYYKNLRIVAPNSNIKLTELKVITANSDENLTKGLILEDELERLYSFEISNTQIDLLRQFEGFLSAPANEDDIIVKPHGVDNPSRQMRPAD